MARATPSPDTLAAAAVPAGLVWVSDAAPGIRRVRRGAAFDYVDDAGRRVRDPATLERIRRLAVPPAYEQVWICAHADGHLQATGRDARGRKQYRYHALWQARRGEDKFASLRAFGAVLPRIRERVRRDLAAPVATRPTRTLVLATLVRLLDTTFVRIGNEEYARGNGSYGLTTLRTRHAGVRDAEVRLSFSGKSGVRHELRLDDARIAAVVRRCKALPGQELFQYVAEDGAVRRISSADVNDYLAEAAGAGVHVTAKDFRTWHGSVLALEFTRVACGAEPVRGAARQVVEQVARRLRNTVAVCRKSYIHPAVLALGAALEAADDAVRAELLAQRWAAAGASRVHGRALCAAERRLLALLGPAAPSAAPSAAQSRGHRTGRAAAPAPASGRTPCPAPAALVPPARRRSAHDESLGFHDPQRAGRPPRREPAARRAGDG